MLVTPITMMAAGWPGNWKISANLWIAMYEVPSEATLKSRIMTENALRPHFAPRSVPKRIRFNSAAVSTPVRRIQIPEYVIRKTALGSHQTISSHQLFIPNTIRMAMNQIVPAME